MKPAALTGSAAIRRLALLMTLAYPAALHLSIVNGQLQWALWILLAVALVRALVSSGYGRLPALALAALAGAGLLTHDGSALYLPPMLIAGFMLYLFGSSLTAGETPLIHRIAQYMDGELDPRTRQYARTVTWAWTLFFAAMLLQTLLLAWLAPLEIWSLFTNFINYLLIAALFLAEYLVRLLYLRRGYSRASLKRAMDLPRLWQQTRGGRST